MKTKTRLLSIRMKVLLSTLVIIVMLVLFMGTSLYNGMEKNMIAMGVQQATVAARVSQSVLNAETVRNLKVGDETTPEYLIEVIKLRSMKENCEVEYIYTLYTDGSKVYYGIDEDPINPVAIGEEFEVSYADLKAAFDGQEVVPGYIEESETGYLISAYIPITDGTGNVVGVLGCDYNADGLMQKLSDVKVQFIAIAVVGLVVAGVIISVILSAILKKLHVVNNKLHELATNDGDLTQVLDVRSGDELELVANNVNALLAFIRQIMISISGNSETLNESSKIIANELRNAEENVMDVSAAMEEMSAAMEETTASLNQINDEIEGVFGRINQIFEAAANGNDMTAAIQKNAGEIYKNAEEKQATAHLRAKEMEVSVQEKIERSKAVEEINVLTESILEITEQTNLLALNASIEAARAGEAGRGFAVVAGEIGNLAKNSAQAAERIKQVSVGVVGAVEELATEAAEMIQFIEENVAEGYGGLLSTSENYQSDAVSIHNMMENFAAESERLEITMKTIKEEVEAINTAVGESTRAVIGVAENSTNLTQSISGIEQKAEENTVIAQNLNLEVDKFKLH